MPTRHHTREVAFAFAYLRAFANLTACPRVAAVPFCSPSQPPNQNVIENFERRNHESAGGNIRAENLKTFDKNLTIQTDNHEQYTDRQNNTCHNSFAVIESKARAVPCPAKFQGSAFTFYVWVCAFS